MPARYTITCLIYYRFPRHGAPTEFTTIFSKQRQLFHRVYDIITQQMTEVASWVKHQQLECPIFNDTSTYFHYISKTLNISSTICNHHLPVLQSPATYTNLYKSPRYCPTCIIPSIMHTIVSRMHAPGQFMHYAIRNARQRILHGTHTPRPTPTHHRHIF